MDRILTRVLQRKDGKSVVNLAVRVIKMLLTAHAGNTVLDTCRHGAAVWACMYALLTKHPGNTVHYYMPRERILWNPIANFWCCACSGYGWPLLPKMLCRAQGSPRPGKIGGCRQGEAPTLEAGSIDKLSPIYAIGSNPAFSYGGEHEGEGRKGKKMKEEAREQP